MCKGCVGYKCKYYGFYADTIPSEGKCRFYNLCMYDDKTIFDKKSHNCPLENNIILNGGFKDDSLIITAGVSSEDIDNLIIEIYEDCIRDHRVAFLTERKIGKLNRIMRDWEMFRLNIDFPFTKHELWIKYNELLKFIEEIERLDKELLEIAYKYDSVGRKILKSKYESEQTVMKTCWFRDLSIGDTFMLWDIKAVKIAEPDMNKDISKQPSNCVIIDDPNKDRIGHYCTLHSNARVKLVKSKGYYDNV